MPRTVLAKGRRFTVRGNAVVLWIPLSVRAFGTALTLAMLDNAATVELQKAISGMTGFRLDQGRLPAPDWGSMRTGTVPGEITTPDSSITFYLSKDGEDAREVLHPGDEGTLLVAEQGLVAGLLCDLYEGEWMYGAKEREDIARVAMPYSIGTVDENVVIPAA